MSMEKNPNPTKDQHFLVDENVIQQICDTADIKEGESIVEIGGGSGAITDYLAQMPNHITVIEKDKYYADYLKQRYANFPNVTVIEGDALDFDYTGYDKIVSNLPYTIIEPLLINLAKAGLFDSSKSNNKGLKSVTLVVSQNSLRKMVSPLQISEGKSKHFNQEFGIMGAICKSSCDLDVISVLPNEAFFPMPAVTSFLINLTPKKERTTVDRIVKEMLLDKKGTSPEIKRVYQLMVIRGEIYKANKHKNNLTTTSSSFISDNIGNQNIYGLTKSQISQLIQTLIRNDISIKSRGSNRRTSDDYDYSDYFVGSRFVGRQDYYEDDYDEFDEEEVRSYGKEKFERKYDYMYDSTKYSILEHRGLEYLSDSDLEGLLTKKGTSQLLLRPKNK